MPIQEDLCQGLRKRVRCSRQELELHSQQVQVELPPPHLGLLPYEASNTNYPEGLAETTLWSFATGALVTHVTWTEWSKPANKHISSHLSLPLPQKVVSPQETQDSRSSGKRRTVFAELGRTQGVVGDKACQHTHLGGRTCGR